MPSPDRHSVRSRFLALVCLRPPVPGAGAPRPATGADRPEAARPSAYRLLAVAIAWRRRAKNKRRYPRPDPPFGPYRGSLSPTVPPDRLQNAHSIRIASSARDANPGGRRPLHLPIALCQPTFDLVTMGRGSAPLCTLKLQKVHEQLGGASERHAFGLVAKQSARVCDEASRGEFFGRTV